ncbi:hypothetical protein CANINC_004235 [Pichia inconspicua]|uniref:Uncharacterized protein n=1 Tax=Pichia inconspicua TaxID=52247 RepID=A0A4T0WWL8_9ASCO|nr:hypothetical protein CANINC_004235 [[Candida] inconspicua]
MLDLSVAPKLSLLTKESRDLLAQVDNYALDYNIFLLKGIHDTIKSNDTELITTIETLHATIPQEYSKIIFNPLKMERHRRDINILNKLTGDKINYIELENPYKYEIKSNFFQAFNANKEEYKEIFRRFALLQSLEYDFEHDLDDDSDYQNDDDLIEHFCDETIMSFKLTQPVKEENVLNNEIVRILLPLASQVIMGQGDDENDEDSIDGN